jgi:hypothetical protein
MTMATLIEVYEQVCLKPHEPPLIARSRHKDVMTALKYLASAYRTTPEKLIFTPTVEAEYRAILRAYFDEHPKGRSTVRNTLQSLAQLWKASHAIQQTPTVPPQPPTVPGFQAAFQHK